MSVLKAEHWNTYGHTPKFEVRLAAQNIHGKVMEMGRLLDRNAVRLVQEAYNLIRYEHHLSHFPGISTFGVYDLNTTECIGKFQDHFNLTFRDGRAGKETITKMDELLVEIEKPKYKPPIKRPWDIILGL